jgi:hypothetical protein
MDCDDDLVQSAPTREVGHASSATCHLFEHSQVQLGNASGDMMAVLIVSVSDRNEPGHTGGDVVGTVNAAWLRLKATVGSIFRVILSVV